MHLLYLLMRCVSLTITAVNSFIAQAHGFHILIGNAVSVENVITSQTATTGNTEGGSITALLTSCLTGLESDVWKLTSFFLSAKQTNPKPVKQEVNGTVIIPPFSIPYNDTHHSIHVITKLPIYCYVKCLYHGCYFAECHGTLHGACTVKPWFL